MSIDILQERIRKTKNPAIVSLSLPKALIPTDTAPVQAREEYAAALLDTLVGGVAGVKVPFMEYAPYENGCASLRSVLSKARELGFYVILDGLEGTPEICPELAELVGPNGGLPCDAITLQPYFGADVLRPFLPLCKKKELAVFLWAKSPNRSAADIQDLLTGSRLVHTAVADLASRLNMGTMGKHGYGQIGLIAAANNSGSVMNFRKKYQDVFLLVEGIDATGGNMKNCSYAFDQFGHGAACCTGPATVEDTVAAAAERMKRNISRYIAIL